MIDSNKLVSKLLVVAGLLLAIPAVWTFVVALFIAIFRASGIVYRMLSAAETVQFLLCAAWIWFCLAGFYLFWRVILCVRADGPSKPPSWLWSGTMVYLLVVTGVSITAAVEVHSQLRAGKLGAADMDLANSGLTFLTTVAVGLPACASVLSSVLWARQRRDNNVRQSDSISQMPG